MLGMKVKIDEWHAVATWTWNAEDDSCGICRSPLRSVRAFVSARGEECASVPSVAAGRWPETGCCGEENSTRKSWRKGCLCAPTGG